MPFSACVLQSGQRNIPRIAAVAALQASLSVHAQPTPPVQVIVDMDAGIPGIQSIVKVRACTSVVPGIAVFIRDPLQQRSVWSIGYLGGIDRGIALGHTPGNGNTNNVGTITGMTAAPGTPVNPGNMPWVEPGFIPAFAGPEVHYLENGAAAPAVIPAQPAAPVFTVDVSIADGHAGDRFHFYLLDYVRVWAGPAHGAFSTQAALNSLDTGGDAVPDQTTTMLGVDPDSPVPAPPASFLVDYIDGPVSGGGAVIEFIRKLGDVNGDNVTDVNDLLAVIHAWGPCPALPANCPADVTEDGLVNVNDLLMVVNNWGGCDGFTQVNVE